MDTVLILPILNFENKRYAQRVIRIFKCVIQVKKRNCNLKQFARIAAKLASYEGQSQINSAVSSGLLGNASYSIIKNLKALHDNCATFYSWFIPCKSVVLSATICAKMVGGETRCA